MNRLITNMKHIKNIHKNQKRKKQRNTKKNIALHMKHIKNICGQQTFMIFTSTQQELHDANRLPPFSNGIEARHIPRFSETNGMLGSPLIMWWIGLIETLPQTAIWSWKNPWFPVSISNQSIESLYRNPPNRYSFYSNIRP